MMDTNNDHNSGPFVRIIEQPARSAVRFRYQCEGRSAGPIPGISSSPSCATYPTIQVANYHSGKAMVMVSCVTASPPYRQHPHHLVGRVGCHNGICSMIIENDDYICAFTHLGIQCAKRNEISARLKQRKLMGVDPTKGGFDHISKSSRGFDLGCVRLCFQVYLEGPDGKFGISLQPVISDPIYDKKLLSKLSITHISSNSVLTTGGKIMLFCNYIDEDDIEVRFFECNEEGVPRWEALANLKPPFGEVHKRVGMSFMAPAYHNHNINSVAQCFMQLRRISDNEASDPLPFYYLPMCHHKCFLLQYYSFNDNISNYDTIKHDKNNTNLTYNNTCQEGHQKDNHINNCGNSTPLNQQHQQTFINHQNEYNYNTEQQNECGNISPANKSTNNMEWSIIYEKANAHMHNNHCTDHNKSDSDDEPKNYYQSIVGPKL